MTLDTVKSVGNYDLLEKIAEGGMGAIYRGRHRESGAIVAIKLMAPHLTRNPLLLKRFEQEFRAASRLNHPNIVRALDYSDNDNRPYLVMEFVEGESLGQKLEREGRMSEAEAIRLITQVAQGLHRAHKENLIHRDVKPDNILVTADGVAKLADLGLVKETETDLNLTRTGRGLGTPHFMAPEQFRNAKNADVRCDIYSLAATLYQMVTGELPFRSNGPLDAWLKKIQNDLVPPRQIVPELSERVDWAIRRALSADPEKRPASCREFIEDLTGKSTRRLPSADSSAPRQEWWYLVYKDETGTPHTVKGTVSAIRRSLKDGLLGDASNVRASRSKAGPFEPINSYSEFRDLVVGAASLSSNWEKGKGERSRPSAVSSDEALPARQAFPQSSQETPSPSAATPGTTVAVSPGTRRSPQVPSPPAAPPTVPPKPLITLRDVPSSANNEAWKWVLFFTLFLLTAVITFWFFR